VLALLLDMAEFAANVEDEYLSSSKLEPLSSPDKKQTRHVDAQGVIGSDEVISTSRISPFPRHTHSHPRHEVCGGQSQESGLKHETTKLQERDKVKDSSS